MHLCENPFFPPTSIFWLCLGVNLNFRLWIELKGPHSYTNRGLCVRVSLDSAFWKLVFSPLWYISICRYARRGKKTWEAQQKCASSLRFTSFMYVCVCLWCWMPTPLPPAAAAWGVFVVDCLQALSQIQFSGVKLVLEIISTKGKICCSTLFMFCMHFHDFLFSKLLVVTH